MKVDGNKPIEANRTSGSRSRGSSPSGFAPIVPEETKPLSQVASAASLSGVDALLALQGVASPAGERQKAVRRGRDMLDALDEIRCGLLEGAVNESTLSAFPPLQTHSARTLSIRGCRRLSTISTCVRG
jgi:hypothetical protein